MRPLMPPVQTPDNLFHDGNPLTGELGTIVDAEHLNNVQGAVRDAQSELITVLTAAGINVDPTKQNQLLTALKALLLSRSNPFGDIKSDGAAAIATALTNLRLQFFLSEPSTFDGSFTSVLSPDEKLRIVLANNGVWGVQDNVGNVVPLSLERGGLGATDVSGALRVLGLDYGSLLPVGVPIPWVFETPPTGFLKYNGASFNKAMYPKLAQIFPSGVLLDLRGVFIRGWDDGKGIDTGRAILTQQQDAQQNINGMVSDVTVGVNAAGTGAFSMVDLTTSGIAAGALNSFYQKHIYLDSSRVVRTATENRPVNIAFNYIVRAA